MNTKVIAGIAGIAILAAVLGLWMLLNRCLDQGMPPPGSTPVTPGESSPLRSPDLASPPAGETRPPAPAAPPPAETAPGSAVGPESPVAAVEPYGALEVKVIWANDQKPAAGTGVRVLPFNGPNPFFNEQTIVADARGVARCERVHRGKVGIFGVFGGELRTTVEAGQETRVTLEIPPGATIEGVVVDGAGKPVADAGIVLGDGGGNSEGPIVAITGPEGSFRLRGIEAKGWRRIGARAAGYAPSAMAMVSANAGGTIRLRLVLDQPGGELSGRVFDPQGNPVARAKVRVGADKFQQFSFPDGTTGSSPGPMTVSTDGDGRFRFVGLARGPNPVHVRSPSWSAWRGVAQVGDEPGPELRIALQPGVVLRGRVVDAAGKPQARVAILVNGYGDLLSSYVRTPEDGTFVLSGLEPGPISVEADGGERGRVSARLDAVPGQEVTWEAVLDGGLSIRGRLLDQTGLPLEGWTVAAETFRPPDSKWLKTDADGGFVASACVDARYTIKVQAPGAKGFPLTTVRDVRPGGPELVIRLTEDLRATCYIQGSVIGPDGLGIGSAEVIYSREGGDSSPIGLTREGSGAFDYGPVPPGTYRVAIRAAGFAAWRSETRVLKAEETWDLGAITLPTPGTLLVRLRHPPGLDISAVHVSVDRGGGPQQGRFHVQGDTARSGPLEAGAYTLHAGGPGILPCTAAVEIRAGDETVTDLDLEAGADRTLLFTEPPGGPGSTTVRIFVRDAAGAVVAGASLRPSEDRPPQFRLTLRTGTYTVEARGDSGRVASGRLTVDAVGGPPQTVEFPLR